MNRTSKNKEKRKIPIKDKISFKFLDILITSIALDILKIQDEIVSSSKGFGRIGNNFEW
ncbi:MAG: hypothetical protein GF329_17820 [Candidatus Lokiarchaeota archaeon]|nr:hypothetical protein [Candidatus Lokiarchaeota archaeon]